MIKIVKKSRHFTDMIIYSKSYRIENEIVYKYQLVDGLEITENKLWEILSDNSYYYYDRIAKNKLKKPMTINEMTKFLQDSKADRELIKRLVNEYIELNYLSDVDYINSYIEFSKKREGPRAIMGKLRAKGLKEDLIRKSLVEIDEHQILLDLVKNSATKKILKSKLAHTNGIKVSLISKGYTEDLVIDIVDEVYSKVKINEDDMIKEEYSFLVNKFASKKNEENFEEFIKSKIYEKGFSENNINKVINKLN